MENHSIQTADSSGWIAERQLPEGSLVRFRHVRPDDEPLIAEAIRSASRETLLHRFFSPIRKVSPDLLRKLLTIDRAEGACLVGVTSDRGNLRIVCGARYVRLADHASAEIALTVHDDFQRHGLGTFMMELLAGLAKADGLSYFEADVMASNAGMLKLLHRWAKNDSIWQRIGDVYHVRFSIAQTAI